MKRCPECRRDYQDDGLLYCLEDGAALIQGSVALPDEPRTAILHDVANDEQAAHDRSPASEAPTKTFESDPPKSASKRSSLIAGVFAIVLAIALGIGGYLYFGRGTSKQIESIAVMPFLNESENTEFEYLADGIPEGIINSLSQLPGLKVMSRNSVFQYKGKPLNAQSIGNDLKVRAVLTGRVLRRGDNLAINIELVDAQDNSQIWGQQYNRKLADVFAVQEEITREISEKLRIKVTGAQELQLAKRPTENLKAFQYYMQGRSRVHRRTREDLLAAMRYYERAIDEDRNYALAYAGVAEAYAQLGVRSYILPAEGRQKALEAAHAALALDENLAEAHVANGVVYIVLPPHDPVLGDGEMRRAIELSPSLAVGHYYLGVSLVRQGRFDEALEKNLKARELDPLSPIIARQVAVHYFFKRDYGRALEQLRQANELGPAFSVSWEVGVYIQNGSFEEALAEIEKAKRERKDDSILVYSTGMIFAAQGKRAEALNVVNELEGMPGAELQQAHFIAKIYAALNEKELAISWLERGLDAGAIGAFYKDEPVWETIRHDARFADLLRRMGIPD